MADSVFETQRKKLHNQLKDVLGSSNVYFQPPNNLQMSYPCIRYQRTSTRKGFANGSPYKNDRMYEIIFISLEPNDSIVDKMEMLPKCRHDRHYKADNLNHDVFTIYV